MSPDAMALVISVVLLWVSVAAMIALPIVQVEWTTVKAIIFTTDISLAFLVRTGLLSAGVLVCVLFARSKHAGLIAAACLGLALSSLA